MTETTPQTVTPLWLRLLPVAVFFAICAAFYWALFYKAPSKVLPSQFIDRAAPEFEAPTLADPETLFTLADLKGEDVVVLNFWASWCAPCRVEHPKLMELAETEGVRVFGVGMKDERERLQSFLDELGDPFETVGVDQRGRVGIEYGVVSLPETFVITGGGKIVYKHIGPINPGELESKIMPAIEAARR